MTTFCNYLSIGLTEYSKGCSVDDVLNKADRALYNAKEEGKNKLRFKKMYRQYTLVFN